MFSTNFFTNDDEFTATEAMSSSNPYPGYHAALPYEALEVNPSIAAGSDDIVDDWISAALYEDLEDFSATQAEPAPEAEPVPEFVSAPEFEPVPEAEPAPEAESHQGAVFTYDMGEAWDAFRAYLEDPLPNQPAPAPAPEAEFHQLRENTSGQAIMLGGMPLGMPQGPNWGLDQPIHHKVTQAMAVNLGLRLAFVDPNDRGCRARAIRFLRDYQHLDRDFQDTDQDIEAVLKLAQEKEYFELEFAGPYTNELLAHLRVHEADSSPFACCVRFAQYYAVDGCLWRHNPHDVTHILTKLLDHKGRILLKGLDLSYVKTLNLGHKFFLAVQFAQKSTGRSRNNTWIVDDMPQVLQVMGYPPTP